MKFSGISQNHRLWDAWGLIQELCVLGLKYWKVVDPPADIAKMVSDLGIKLVVRHNWDGVPDTPEMFYNSCKIQPWYRYAWAVETPNEPFGYLEMPAWYIRLEERLVQLFAQDGKECVVNNLGTGNIGHFVNGARYYGAHEYGYFYPLSHSPYHGLRYRDWFGNNLDIKSSGAKLFITEFGTTRLIEYPVDGLDYGYRTAFESLNKHDEYWENGIKPYLEEIDKDDYVEAAFYFVMGGIKEQDCIDSGNEPIEGKCKWESHDGIDGFDKYVIEYYENKRSLEIVGVGTYISSYPELYSQWVKAGGIENNFAAFVIGQLSAQGHKVTKEQIQIVYDRVQSSLNELDLIVSTLII